MTDSETPSSVFVPLSYITDIVSAFVSNNSIPAENVPGFISKVTEAVYQAADHIHTQPAAAAPPAPVRPVPAVSIAKSITPDFLICLEDGRKFKSLKRHLHATYGLSPQEYREKWGLDTDYPMVAPNYSAQRSALARDQGLGRQEPVVAKASTRGSAVKRGRPAGTKAKKGGKRTTAAVAAE